MMAASSTVMNALQCELFVNFFKKMFNILQHHIAKHISFIILKAGATLYKLHIHYDNSIQQVNQGR